MADASRLKGVRRQGLGAPPSLEEARTDLALTPEPPELSLQPFSGARPDASVPEGRATPSARGETRQVTAAEPPRAGRIDARTLRRSGRTVQFATRVSPEFDERVRRIAMRDGLLLVEVLERALDAYEHSSKKEAR
jgi:hypothetical protein